MAEHIISHTLTCRNQISTVYKVRDGFYFSKLLNSYIYWTHTNTDTDLPATVMSSMPVRVRGDCDSRLVVIVTSQVYCPASPCPTGLKVWVREGWVPNNRVSPPGRCHSTLKVASRLSAPNTAQVMEYSSPATAEPLADVITVGT